jgi:hypothetical protein
MGLRIHEVSPTQGWPGTLVEIAGEGFDPQRDSNLVIVGDRPALVVRASSERLLAMAAEDARTGEIRVEVGPERADGPGFELMPYPEEHDWVAPAAPRFFHGPQHGTPAANVQNQRVLVLPVFPTDQFPLAVPFLPDPLQELDAKYAAVADYWRAATYGATTWKFERHPDWLPLPRSGNEYILTQPHVDAARTAYLAGDRRITGDGHVIFASADNSFIPTLHPSPLSWSYLIGSGPGDGAVLALRKVGNTLYLGTAGGTFAVYDVASPAAPVLVGSVDTGSPVWDIAFVGANAVLAQGSDGIGLVDVSNPASPSVLIPSTDGEGAKKWATRVQTVGNRIYSNRGPVLRVQDLTALMTFADVAEVTADAWIMDIAADAGRCVVATDGRGILTFETTAAGLLEKARFRDLEHPREIRLAGNIAWVAASDEGLAAVDVGNLAAPAVLGTKKFKKDANSLIVKGDEAIVSLGDIVMVSVNIGNPGAMTLNGGEAKAAYNVPMADRRAFLYTMIDEKGAAVDFDRIFIDALHAWFAATGGNVASLDPYEGIVLSFSGPTLRAHSGLGESLFAAGEHIKFNDTKGLFYERDSNPWTTPAHELVHWLEVKDLYQQEYADGSVEVGTAGPWCMSGSSGSAPLFCAQRLTDALKSLAVGGGPAENVRQLVWTPTSQIDEHHDLVAHGANQDGDPKRVHALRLVVSSAMTYWVEVRQHAPAGLPFDQGIPVPAGAPGCVLVTRATDEQSIVDNSFERPVQLMGVLAPGGKVVDASRNLIISVDRQIQADPLAYRVRVQWNQPIPDNPDGAFDLAITPWDLTTYETPDIWIDSTRSNGVGIYEFHEPGDPTRPILNGDPPWVKHDNKIKARIRNTGPVRVDDVYVTCYITSPPGIGDNGEWQTLETKSIASIPGHGAEIVEFDWKPEVDQHTCISVAALPKLGEVTGGNNSAQENVAVFDSPSGSSHEPVILEAQVRNPFTIGKRVDLFVRHLPDRWHAVVDRSHVWLGGKGSAPVRAVIWTDLQTTGLEGEEGERLAKPTVEGWTFHGHRRRPIGGILAPVRAVPGVTIDFDLEHGGEAIYVWGSLTPPARQVPIAVEIRAESGQSWMLYDTTDNSGQFSPSTPKAGITLEPGRYTVQVFTAGSPHAAETESEIREVDL